MRSIPATGIEVAAIAARTARSSAGGVRVEPTATNALCPAPVTTSDQPITVVQMERTLRGRGIWLVIGSPVGLAALGRTAVDASRRRRSPHGA